MRANNSATSGRARGRPAERCEIPCFKGELVARKRAALPQDDRLEEAEILFGALADRVRLKILHSFMDGDELCVCDVAHVLGMSISAASHHLRKLRDLRVLKYRTDGRMSYYSIRDPVAVELLRRALRRRSR